MTVTMCFIIYAGHSFEVIVFMQRSILVIKDPMKHALTASGWLVRDSTCPTSSDCLSLVAAN